MFDFQEVLFWTLFAFGFIYGLAVLIEVLTEDLFK